MTEAIAAQEKKTFGKEDVEAVLIEYLEVHNIELPAWIPARNIAQFAGSPGSGSAWVVRRAVEGYYCRDIRLRGIRSNDGKIELRLVRRYPGMRRIPF